MLAGHQAFAFRDCGSLPFKGITAPVVACEARWQAGTNLDDVEHLASIVDPGDG